MKVYTIKEIAKMANVSAGTVDRVLHKRGKVSPEKEDRVRAILKKIDYRPNQVARSLKLNKRFRLVVLFPDSDLDEYWKPCFDGIASQVETLEERGVFITILKYDPANASHFKEKCEESITLNPDCVMLGSLFLHESQEYLNKLKDLEVPFGLINTVIEGVDFLTYVGQNLIVSGRTAAHLFDTFLPAKKKLLIVHIAEDFENALHMQRKEKGFREYFNQNGNETEIYTANVTAENPESIRLQLKDYLSVELHGIFVTTSKAHTLSEVFENVPIIGYDLLSENIKKLKTGQIQFLIYQNPKLQASKGILFLSEFILRDTTPPQTKYLPIEIISSENVSSYQV